MRGSDAFTSMIEKKMKLTRILWFGFTGAILMYAAVGYAVSLLGAPAEPLHGMDIIRHVMLALGLATGLGAMGLRIALFTRERIEARLKAPVNLRAMAWDRGSGQTNPATLAALEEMTEEEQRVMGIVQWYLARYILLLAINESVALFGLVLTLLTRAPGEMLVFLLVALFLNARMLVHPRQIIEEAQAAAERP